MRAKFVMALLAGGLACLSTSALSASARTYVAMGSAGGSDTNTSYNCNADHSCRTIRTALTVTSAGGEVVMMTTGNYGVFTFSQSVTIMAAPGIYTGIAAPVGYSQAILVDGAGIDPVAMPCACPLSNRARTSAAC